MGAHAIWLGADEGNDAAHATLSLARGSKGRTRRYLHLRNRRGALNDAAALTASIPRRMSKAGRRLATGVDLAPRQKQDEAPAFPAHALVRSVHGLAFAADEIRARY